ncbi:MAG: hypothetical protein HPY75_12760 [Actinobacteria bacterium]|nr:hypothetical protein [Actinomycetota bacterium]
MKLRKYRGRDVAALKKRIREELGEDAVIVSTRQVIEGGVMGFFGRSMVEMVAVLPDGTPDATQDTPRVDIAVPEEVPRVLSPAVESGTAQARKAMHVDGDTGIVEPAGCTPGSGLEDKCTRDERRAPEERGRKPRRGNLDTGEAQKAGFSPCLRADGGSRRSSRPDDVRKRGEDNRSCADEARGSGQVFVPLRYAVEAKKEGMPRIPERAVVLGPSGVGKTTCLGRLAWALTGRGVEVTLLSLEEEGRLSGVSRWGELWEAMGVEYRACLDMGQLLREASGARGAVLVDTPPLTPRGVEAWSEALVGGLSGFEMVLVLEARMDDGEYSAWLRRCEPLEPYMLVISKADELFDAVKAERMARSARAAEVMVANDPSIVKPMLAFDGLKVAEERAGPGV